jgi:predicted phage terminase large subunit-like protein
MQRQQQINDHKRIASFSKLLKENPKDIRLAEALLSACANATAKDDGSYETKTVEAEYAFKKGMEVYNACLFNAANARDIDNKRKWLVLTKSSLLFLAHKYFDSFMLYLEFDRRPDKRFYAPRKNQLKPIVDGFQDVADGKVDLLTVSQPKRTGKTTLGLLFVIWRAGMQPDKSCFLVGRGDSLAKSFYDGCLTFLQDKAEYNYWDVFPGHALSATNAEQRTIDLDSRHRFPTIMCNSIDSQITGRTEASNLLYCDDLVIGADDARNKDRLDNLWDKVRSDCLGRRKEHVPIIAQGTRFSIYDPIGHLIDIAPEMGWRTKVIEVPALDYKTDESNFYYKYGMGFSTEYYRNERKLVTDLQWESEFQQRPIEEKGVVFGKSDLQYYDKLPENVDWDAILAVIDPSEGKGDFTSMVVAFVSGVDVYIEDVVYSQALPEVNAPKCGIMCVKHGVKVCQVESNANGLLFAEKVENQINGMGGRTSVRTKRTTANKQTKIILASDNIRNHFWFKNPNYLSNASEYAHFLRDTWSYSQVSRNQHDDSVDSLAMMENMIANLTTGKVQAFKRPF